MVGISRCERSNDTWTNRQPASDILCLEKCTNMVKQDLLEPDGKYAAAWESRVDAYGLRKLNRSMSNGLSTGNYLPSLASHEELNECVVNAVNLNEVLARMPSFLEPTVLGRKRKDPCSQKNTQPTRTSLVKTATEILLRRLHVRLVCLPKICIALPLIRGEASFTFFAYPNYCPSGIARSTLSFGRAPQSGFIDWQRSLIQLIPLFCRAT